MRYAVGVLLSLLLLQSASAARWYYPDASDHKEVLDSDWALTGAVLVGLDGALPLPDHPDVVSVEWLSTEPAFARLVLRPGADDLSVSRQLHDLPAVQWSHPDFWIPMALRELPDDPYVADQWHLENDGRAGIEGVDINAEGAWAWTAGAGEIVAIIDSGVDAAHPDLSAQSGTDYIGGDSDSYPEDGNAHGTACAGIAAATGDNGLGGAGVAYEAEVYGIRLIGGGATASDTYKAFREAADAGAAVISNSWGYSTSCDGFTMPTAFRVTLDYVEESGRGGLGTLVAQAAGNDNCDISRDGLLAYETTFVVGAIGSADVKEGYSSFGAPLDIMAPAGLLTTNITGDAGYPPFNGDMDHTGGMSGTSAATPVVAGVATLMFAANPRLTAADARDVLCATATRNDIPEADFDETGWSNTYGCGRVDAAAAVAAVANAEPGAPTPTEAAESYVDRVWLDWLPADDPDGDHLAYRVEWWVGDDTEATTIEDVSGLSLELTDAAGADAGEALSWRVQAVDLWGAGPWSDTATTDIIDRPVKTRVTQPAQGCQAAGGGLWWLALAALVGRLKRQ